MAVGLGAVLLVAGCSDVPSGPGLEAPTVSLAGAASTPEVTVAVPSPAGAHLTGNLTLTENPVGGVSVLYGGDDLLAGPSLLVSGAPGEDCCDPLPGPADGRPVSGLGDGATVGPIGDVGWLVHWRSDTGPDGDAGQEGFVYSVAGRGVDRDQVLAAARAVYKTSQLALPDAALPGGARPVGRFSGLVPITDSAVLGHTVAYSRDGRTPQVQLITLAGDERVTAVLGFDLPSGPVTVPSAVGSGTGTRGLMPDGYPAGTQAAVWSADGVVRVATVAPASPDTTTPGPPATPSELDDLLSRLTVASQADLAEQARAGRRAIEPAALVPPDGTLLVSAVLSDGVFVEYTEAHNTCSTVSSIPSILGGGGSMGAGPACLSDGRASQSGYFGQGTPAVRYGAVPPQVTSVSLTFSDGRVLPATLGPVVGGERGWIAEDPLAAQDAQVVTSPPVPSR